MKLFEELRRIALHEERTQFKMLVALADVHAVFNEQVVNMSVGKHSAATMAAYAHGLLKPLERWPLHRAACIKFAQRATAKAADLFGQANGLELLGKKGLRVAPDNLEEARPAIGSELVSLAKLASVDQRLFGVSPVTLRKGTKASNTNTDAHNIFEKNTYGWRV